MKTRKTFETEIEYIPIEIEYSIDNDFNVTIYGWNAKHPSDLLPNEELEITEDDIEFLIECIESYIDRYAEEEISIYEVNVFNNAKDWDID